MTIIILTGILSWGIIPLISAIGYGFELIISIFKPVSWDYWQQVAVGLVFALLASVNFIPIRKKGKSK
jgi:hypothetical protein